MRTLPIITLTIALAAAIGFTPGHAQDDATQKAAPETTTVPDEAKPEPAVAEVAEPAVAEEVQRECHLFGVTWDGGSKRGAVTRAQSGLKKTIADWRAKQGRKSGWRSDGVTIEPRRMRPNPYWRSKVSSNLYYKPDVRTSTSYTVCWKGVISTAVCTAGSKVCK